VRFAYPGYGIQVFKGAGRNVGPGCASLTRATGSRSSKAPAATQTKNAPFPARFR